MFKLYYKHLYPSIIEWQDEPFAPWSFKEQVLLNVLPFFESTLLKEEFSLKKEIGCEIFMDSGAFTAASMGYELDPYEVAEMQALLKADLVVPVDKVVFREDSYRIVNQKIEDTISNTEILLDLKHKTSQVIGPLQGFTKEILEHSFNEFKKLGIQRFAISGLVFESEIKRNMERIALTREITKGYPLHIFGKFLHPELLKLIIDANTDSVDGYGCIIASLKGNYIFNGTYESISDLTDDEIDLCSCSICQENSYENLSRVDKESQHLLIIHNIIALNNLKEELLKQKSNQH
ncbi:MAG: tRNA-guanine transglycosylase [Candidatus Heimdallarchaeota archaeon]